MCTLRCRQCTCTFYDGVKVTDLYFWLSYATVVNPFERNISELLRSPKINVRWRSYFTESKKHPVMYKTDILWEEGVHYFKFPMLSGIMDDSKTNVLHHSKIYVLRIFFSGRWLCRFWKFGHILRLVQWKHENGRVVVGIGSKDSENRNVRWTLILNDP